MPSYLTDFKALSFDCYGTLIDWETGIWTQLQLLVSRLPENHPFRDRDTLIRRYNVFQREFQREDPKTLYNDGVAGCFVKLAEEANIPFTQAEAEAFGRSAGSWPAFPDTVEALKVLKRYYKLVIISNVDNDNVQRTLEGPFAGVDIDVVLTAEDMGAYKPDHNNFRILFDTVKQKFGVEKKQLLHVAKSLPIDHVPAKELGLTSVWIARGPGGSTAMGGNVKEYDGKVAFSWRFPTLGDMAAEVEKAFAEK
ncbi:hypothetical protein M409DRAFT_35871 [Zasmidium cellare ATCC 36951]|uniref:Haloacid dehalogenase n=1 Tax=Zasmidium cellare ATCC 36951 TaxID=1080233 RepID=A0A6A6CV41_ZASCE|nr:uncharacterized protein M409DRAFT_35871 [Zasmidium cellare ATCC 36951]KAF2170981.1 hypothetical protein M409DRAFT_35871 [Zasmidium cellare ATCC 36951]